MQRVGGADGCLADASFAKEKGQLGRVGGFLWHSDEGRGEHEGKRKGHGAAKTVILVPQRVLRDLLSSLHDLRVGLSVVANCPRKCETHCPQSLS